MSVAIAAGSIKEGFNLPLHNPGVTFDEDALDIGCEVFAYNALKVLSSEE